VIARLRGGLPHSLFPLHVPTCRISAGCWQPGRGLPDDAPCICRPGAFRQRAWQNGPRLARGALAFFRAGLFFRQQLLARLSVGVASGRRALPAAFRCTRPSPARWSNGSGPSNTKTLARTCDNPRNNGHRVHWAPCHRPCCCRRSVRIVVLNLSASFGLRFSCSGRASQSPPQALVPVEPPDRLR